MIRSCGICIFISGSIGTYEEFQIANKYSRILFPIGFTGGIAAKTCQELIKNHSNKVLMNFIKLQGRDVKHVAKKIVEKLYLSTYES